MLQNQININRQLQMEAMYSKTNIKAKIQTDLEQSGLLMEMMGEAVQLLEEWLAKDHVYLRKDGSRNEVKNERLAQLSKVDLGELVMNVMVTMMTVQKAELFTSVVGRLAGCLSYSNREDGIKTLSEVLAVTAPVGLFTIIRDRGEQMMIMCEYSLPQKTRDFIQRTKYLPPMLCEPVIVENNYDSGYLTKKESLILGEGNYHNGDIGLDVINRFNQTALSLDLRLLKMYEEMPNHAFVGSTKDGVFTSAADKEAKFKTHMEESRETYVEIAAHDNKFWLTHKKDKRGRTYSQGYHISTQGTKFKKAVINFHHEELIEGV